MLNIFLVRGGLSPVAPKLWINLRSFPLTPGASSLGWYWGIVSPRVFRPGIEIGQQVMLGEGLESVSM